MSERETRNSTLPEADAMTVVSCQLAFNVTEPAELVLQIAAGDTAGLTVSERFEIRLDGEPLSSVRELRGPHSARLQVVQSPRGQLGVDYRAEIQTLASGRSAASSVNELQLQPSLEFQQIMYERPSRYCPSDHLAGFALSEFGNGSEVSARVEAITEWIRRRIEYTPGTGTVHDSAEHTLLTGAGSCRDFAHLGVALCRALGVAARFTAVYAPGLFPMDFHAVFETLENGRWCLHDATDLAPRLSMVRIVTGRDAADAAFAAITRGTASLEMLEVNATAGSSLASDERSLTVELA